MGIIYGSELNDPIKIEFNSGLALGDTLMMTCAVRDLKASYPDRYLIKVNTLAQHVWDNNPNLSTFDDPDMIVELGPRKITQASQTNGLHYANGFRLSMEMNLNIPIRQGKIKPDLYLSDAEKKDKIIEGKYWILVAGGKKDFGTKVWPPEYWKKVVDHFPQITFVQLGESKHNHPVIEAPNVINMIGSTENPDEGIRNLFKLFYHCEGSLGLVSMQMHLAAAFEKACVVVAGAREPVSFERYNHHQYLCNQGTMRCKNDCTNCTHFVRDGKQKKFCGSYGGPVPADYLKDRKRCHQYSPIDPAKLYIKSCWKSKLEGCTNLVSAHAGDRFERPYPKCIVMIRPADVITAINDYYIGGALQFPKKKASLRLVPESSHKPFPVPTDKPIFKMVCNAHAYIGGERSCAWIMNAMIKEGYHVQLVPTKHVCDEFAAHIPDVEITRKLTDPCDILMIYANDMIWEFGKPPYTELMPKAMENADRNILMLNFKLGAAGKAEWTKHFDFYGFLCSQMKRNFEERVPGASCFVLPPAVDIDPFLDESISYNRTFHMVRHSSQGDAKHPKDTAQMIQLFREGRPKMEFSFMPPPTFLPPMLKVYHFHKNEIPVIDFLKRGTCYWYRLPDGYSDQGPRTIVEAMAIGLPVIADNRWGAADRVTKETGWLCDDDEDYLDTIKYVTHQELAEKGGAAKQRARERFHPSNWIRQITS